MRKSRTLERADAIEARVLSESERAYDLAVSRVIRKHAATFRRIRQMEEKGQFDQVRVLCRTSGLLDDLADAVASAGEKAAELIRNALEEVRAVMADDDGETP